MTRTTKALTVYLAAGIATHAIVRTDRTVNETVDGAALTAATILAWPLVLAGLAACMLADMNHELSDHGFDYP